MFRPITIEEYFGPWINHADATVAKRENAQALLGRVNSLLLEAVGAGVEVETNPATHSHVSGQAYGGFRPQACPQGAPDSSHKTGEGVDVFDPIDALDDWISHFDTENGGNTKLEECGLYREHPDDTRRWCHLTTRAPKSKRRTFKP